MKTKTWILLIALLVVISLGLSLFFLLPGENAQGAQVWSEGKLIATLPLNQDQSITVKTEKGINVVTVSDGAIGVTEANCPDKHCINRGMCKGGTQIVCLPNRLVIKFIGEQNLDSMVG